MRAIRLFFVLMVVGFVCAPATAAVVGPVWPAPGGTSYSSSGAAPFAGGLTGEYTNFNQASFDELWWGLWSTSYPAISLAGGGSPVLTFDAAASDLASGVAVFTGQSYMALFNGTALMDTRWTIRATNLTGSSLAFVTGDSEGVAASPILLPVTGSFKLNHAAEARYAGGGNFAPVSDVFNAAHTPAGAQYTTDLSGGFYYTEPTPTPTAVPLPAAVYCGLALLSALAVRRPIGHRRA